MKFIKSLIPDFLILGGSAAISYGSYLIHEPAGFIAGGVIGSVIGVLMVRAGR